MNIVRRDNIKPPFEQRQRLWLLRLLAYLSCFYFLGISLFKYGSK